MEKNPTTELRVTDTTDSLDCRRRQLLQAEKADECPVPLIFNGNDCMCVTDVSVRLNREMFLQKHTYQHQQGGHERRCLFSVAHTNGLQ